MSWIESLRGWFKRIAARKRAAPAGCGAPLCPAGICALVHLPCGACAFVKALELSPEAANRLRQMGIREGCRIALLSCNEPVLVSVENTRIALGTQLARQIKVETV